MLLAAATDAAAGERVVEFGAGVGAAGLALAQRVAGIDLTLVEIDAALAALARENAALNGIECRAWCSMSQRRRRRLQPRVLRRTAPTAC